MGEHEETEKLLDEAEREHVEVKVMIEEMKSHSLSSPNFREKLSDLKEALQQHVEEQENEVFSQVRQCMSAEELDQLEEEFQNMRNKLLEEMVAAT
jgi:hemerythrin-like domain-containing protein